MSASSDSRVDDGSRTSVFDALAACFVFVVRWLLKGLAYTALGISTAVGLVRLAWRRGRTHASTGWRVLRRGIAWLLWQLLRVMSFIPEWIGLYLGDDVTGKRGQERVPPNEEFHTDRISADILDKLRDDYSRGVTRRDAHPKHHGLLRATFRIADDVPDELRQGLFAEAGREHDAWLRFSNASPTAQADANSDVRGCAIKLRDARAGRAADGEPPDHDLLLITEPVFLTHTVAQFSYFQRAVMRRRWAHFLWLLYAAVAPWRWYIYRNLFRIGVSRHDSLLNIVYHSATPYALGGDLAVRYRLVPQKLIDVDRKDRSTDRLRHDLRRHLRESDVVFDFLVQPQVSGRIQAIERPGREWSDRRSPPVRVATLTIRKQCFDTPAQMQQAEHVTYTPWHSLPEHRPLGGINRAREVVYRRTASFRHERNEVDRSRPTCDELEETWLRYNG